MSDYNPWGSFHTAITTKMNILLIRPYRISEIFIKVWRQTLIIWRNDHFKRKHSEKKTGVTTTVRHFKKPKNSF